MPQQIPANITTPIDSIVADSAAVQPQEQFVPQYLEGFHEQDTVEYSGQRIENYSSMKIPQASEAKSYENSFTSSNMVMGMLLVVLFIILISYHKGYKYLANMYHNLFSVRVHENFLNDLTADENQIIAVLTINTCFMQSLLMCAGLNLYLPHLQLMSNVNATVLVLMGIAVAFYLLQMAFYATMGYVFADKKRGAILMAGFKASQALMGILLLPLGAFVVVNPNAASTIIPIAAGVYVLIRFVFIFKGFRIFFNNIASFFFFILYLCTAEVIPLIMIYSLSVVFLQVIKF